VIHPSTKPSQKMNGCLCHSSTKPSQKMNGYLYHPSTKPSKKMNGSLCHPSTKPRQKLNGYLYHPSTKPSQNCMHTYIIHLPSQAKTAWIPISSIFQVKPKLHGHLYHPSTKPKNEWISFSSIYHAPNRLKTFAWKARRVLSFEPTTGVGNEVGG
jgi:hypothetical protein